MAMTQVTIALTGTRPLITHNERLANPLDEGTQKLSALTHDKAGKKTVDGLEAIARLEWELGQYRNEAGPVIPLFNVRKCLIEAGRKSKQGMEIVAAVRFTDESAKLEYDGPRALDAMWKAKRFTDMRTVVVGGRRVLRSRPIYPEWKARFTLEVDSKKLDPEKIVTFAKLAGDVIGLCEMRPGKGGFYGTFRAELV